MKTKHISILVSAICLMALYVSCSESEPFSEKAYKNSWINVSLPIVIGDGDDSGQFNVSCSGTWNVVDCPSWIHLMQTSGNGQSNVSFTVDENDTGSPRSGNITVNTSNYYTKEATIGITQQPTHDFKITTDELPFTASADSKTLSVSASESWSWTVTKNDSWIHFDKLDETSNSRTGKGSSRITLYADENPDTLAREAVINISTGKKSATLTIKQNAQVSNFEVKMAETHFDTNGELHYLDIKAWKTRSWSVNCNESWVHLDTKTGANTYSGRGDKLLNIYVEENPTYKKREAVLVITSGSVTKNITITQGEFVPTMELSDPPKTISADGGSCKVDVTTNRSTVEWKVSKADSWIHLDSSSSTSSELTKTGSKSVTIYVDINNTNENRKAILTFTSAAGTKTITISQDAFKPTMKISGAPTSYVNADGSNFKIDVTTNRSTVEWKVSKTDSWIHLDSSSSSSSQITKTGSKSITIYVDKNTTYETRKTILTFSSAAGTQKVEISQNGQESTMTVKPTDDKTFDAKGGNFSVSVTTAPSSLSWKVNKYVSWIHLDSKSYSSDERSYTGSKSVTIYVDENPYESSREATLYFKSEVGTETIKISQTGKQNFSVSMTSKNYNNKAGSLPLTITASSSVNWTVKRSSSDTWVHLSSSTNTSNEVKGSGNKTLNIYVDKNQQTKTRYSTITISAPGFSSQYITIFQDAGVPFEITSVDTRCIYFDGDKSSFSGSGSYIGTITSKIEARLKYTAYTAGSYKIDEKVYYGSTLLKFSGAPVGYSSTYTYYLSGSGEVYWSFWNCWADGDFKAGGYTIEFYYKDTKIGSIYCSVR